MLNQVFGASSRSILADFVTAPVALAYDLGCGPGHTTAMVAQLSRAARTIGLPGVVLVDEIEWIQTSQPVLSAHLRLAEALVAVSGARMVAGPRLAGLADVPRLRAAYLRIAQVPVPTALAATLFSMNIAAWGDRPVDLGLCDATESARSRLGHDGPRDITGDGRDRLGHAPGRLRAI